MGTPDSWVVVGLDNGGTSNNATVLDASGRFLVDRLVETPSCVQEGPDVAVEALVQALDHILEQTGTAKTSVRAVGLDTPGPASTDGVISSKGATNFSQPAWVAGSGGSGWAGLKGPRSAASPARPGPWARRGGPAGPWPGGR